MHVDSDAGSRPVRGNYDAQGDPSRLLQDLAEELGRMAARAVLRAVEDPKTTELIIGLAVLLISVIVIAREHSSTLAGVN